MTTSRFTLAIALAAVCTTSAHALPSDVKTLAQFDLGYAKCEKRVEKMRGLRDDAYLALWKVKPDAKRRAELSSVRQTAKYKKEREAALKAMDNSNSAELEEKIRRQCEGTWGELQRNAPSAK